MAGITAGGRAANTYAFALGVSHGAGVVDGVEIDPSGVLCVIGWENEPGVIPRAVEVRLNGERLAPATILGIHRPDVAAALRDERAFRGVRIEYLLCESHQGACLTVAINGGVALEAIVPAVRQPAYAHLYTAAEVFHRDGIYGTGPAQIHVDAEVWELCKTLPDPILDFGCGSGALVAKLSEAGKDARGLEIESEHGAQALLPSCRERVRLYDGQLPSPFADGAFAAVTCVEVLEHVSEIAAVVAELARLTREQAFVTVPDITAVPLLHRHGVVPWHLLEATHINFLGPRSLLALLTPHFRQVQLFRIGANTINGTTYFASLGALCGK